MAMDFQEIKEVFVFTNKIGSAQILEGLKKMEDSGVEINIFKMLKDMVKKNENIFDKQDQKITL